MTAMRRGRCCDECGCHRVRPVRIRRTPFSDRYVAITNYTERGDGTLRSADGGQHDVDTDVRHYADDAVTEELLDLHKTIGDSYDEFIVAFEQRLAARGVHMGAQP